MEQGHFAAHVRRMRQAYREQRDALAATLIQKAAGRLQIDVPDQGMHLVAHLEPGRRDTEIEAAAARAGVVVRAISRFYRRASPRPGLMLGFSGFPRRLIVPAAELLAEVVAKHGQRPRSGP
jgi:GntR family transcriptional regulator/MocR family aminotransferase